MKKIQEVIKEAAERYGLSYNEEQDNPKIKLKDGTIKDFDITDLNNIIRHPIGCTSPSIQEHKNNIKKEIDEILLKNEITIKQIDEKYNIK